MDSTKMKCEMFVECQNMESHINSEKPQKALSESWKENSIVLASAKGVVDTAESFADTGKCNICHVPVPLGGMKGHVNGKKHQCKLKKIRRAVKSNAESDVNEAPVTEIAEGTSKEVSVEQELNSTEATTERDVCTTTAKPGEALNHVKSNKLKKKLRQKKTLKKKKTWGVRVIDFTSTTTREDLVRYFGTFGEIRSYDLEGENLNIHYSDPSAARTVLDLVHNVQHTFLTVTPLNPKKTVRQNLTAVTEVLKGARNLDQQISLFLDTIKPQYPAILDKYKTLCNDLLVTLKQSFPSCQVHEYGSTLTGLYCKESDADVFVQLPKDAKYQAVLQKARRTLFQSKIFSDIECLFYSETPIVKCLHVPTNIRCDLNFKAMLGVCNSRLIGYYLSLDQKLIPAMLILKYWAKMLKPSGPQKFRTYALTMLMIFYLQNPPFNLPSVKSLQSNILFEQDGWNGGFLPLEGFQSEALKNATIPDLLQGFFEFYAVFDFGLYVICPLIGTKLPKFAFFQADTLPDDFSRYKQQGTTLVVDTSICVQDPFELSRNLTVSIPIKGLKRFIIHCKKGAEICRGAKTDFLYRLFTSRPKMRAVTSEEVHFELRLEGHMRYIYDRLPPARRTIKAVQVAWFERMNSFLLYVLTLVLRLEVEPRPAAPPSKSRRLEGQRDVHGGNVVDAITFHCTGTRYLWQQRKAWLKKFSSRLPRGADFLEKEIALTEAVCELGGNPRQVLVDFDMQVTAKTKPAVVEFQMKRIQGNAKVFYKLGSFFNVNYGQWFSTYLDEKSKLVINQTRNSDA